MPKTNKDVMYSISHCIQRFAERYNKELDIKMYESWNSKIRNFIEKNNNDENIILLSKKKVNKFNFSYVFSILWENSKVYATFETGRNCITTFLPKNSFEK